MIVYRPMQEKDLDMVTALEAAAFSKPWQQKDFALLCVKSRNKKKY